MMKSTLILLAALASPAFAAAPLQHKSATLQCHERVVALEADCFQAMGRRLACNRQSLSFTGADGKKLSIREFKPVAGDTTYDYPAIEEKVGNLACVDTADKQSYVVARMNNGGNCQQCEWFDVYTVDGVLVGDNRNRKKKNLIVDAAVDAAYDEKVKRVVSENDLEGFYFRKVKP